MKLRRAPRYKRRLPVRFWHPETGDAHQALTIDISLVGMFIGTRSPLPRGSRLRIEVLEPGHNYVFQVEVVRSARVAPELQRVSPSGMGVRLLSVRELVQELIPVEAEKARTVPPSQASAKAAEAQDEHERPTGMRVTFLDPDDAMEQLRAMIRRLRDN